MFSAIFIHKVLSSAEQAIDGVFDKHQVSGTEFLHWKIPVVLQFVNAFY